MNIEVRVYPGTTPTSKFIQVKTGDSFTNTETSGTPTTGFNEVIDQAVWEHCKKLYNDWKKNLL